MSSQPDRKLRVGWPEKLLLFLIIVAAFNGLAIVLSQSVEIGMAVSVLALTIVALASTALDRPSVSRHAWHSYLEGGKLPRRPVPLPRFSLTALLELTVLVGLLFGVSRYLNSHEPRELKTYVIGVGYYLWIVFWTTVIVLSASQSAGGDRSPAMYAGVGGSCAGLVYLVVFSASLVGHADFLPCFVFGGLLSGVLFAMPLGSLICYWSHRQE